MRKSIISAVILAMALLGGCGYHASSGYSLTTKVSCAVQYHKWYKSGGKTELENLRANLKPMETAAKNHQKGEVQADATRVENASTALLSHLPPNCVPGVDPQVRVVLTDTTNGVKASSMKNYTEAKADAKDAQKHLLLAVDSIKKYVEG